MGGKRTIPLSENFQGIKGEHGLFYTESKMFKIGEFAQKINPDQDRHLVGWASPGQFCRTAFGVMKCHQKPALLSRKVGIVGLVLFKVTAFKINLLVSGTRLESEMMHFANKA